MGDILARHHAKAWTFDGTEGDRCGANAELAAPVLGESLRQHVWYRRTAISSASHPRLLRLRITLPATQVDGRNPVKKRRMEQPGRRIDQGGDLEELATDDRIGLTCGQHPVHKPVGNTHRRRSSSLHLRESQVRT